MSNKERFDELMNNAKDKKKQLEEIKTREPKEMYLDDLKELREAGAVKVDIGKNIDLENKAIIYMENLPADTIKGWLSFGAQFIP